MMVFKNPNGGIPLLHFHLPNFWLSDVLRRLSIFFSVSNVVDLFTFTMYIIYKNNFKIFFLVYFVSIKKIGTFSTILSDKVSQSLGA